MMSKKEQQSFTQVMTTLGKSIFYKIMRIALLRNAELSTLTAMSKSQVRLTQARIWSSALTKEMTAPVIQDH